MKAGKAKSFKERNLVIKREREIKEENERENKHLCTIFLDPTYKHCVHSCLAAQSCVQLFMTLWTIVCQAPLFMGFFKQEY